jgi:hypothetical protein
MFSARLSDRRVSFIATGSVLRRRLWITAVDRLRSFVMPESYEQEENYNRTFGGMVQRGFGEMEKRFDAVDDRFDRGLAVLIARRISTTSSLLATNYSLVS